MWWADTQSLAITIIGIVLEAYCPLGQHPASCDDVGSALNNPVVIEIAEKHSVTAAQVHNNHLFIIVLTWVAIM